MIDMKEWMELVDYKITEGDNYGWSCFGSNSYQLSSWNGVHGKGGYSFNIVFSTKSHKVYCVEVCDYTNDRAYRMINPDYVKKHEKEAKNRDVNMNEAWDEVDFVDLEVDDDFIQKALSIKAGEDYENTVSVPIDLPDDLLLEAAMNAHRQNITLNEYINNALRELVDEFKQDPEGLLAQADKWKEENDIA
jgi:Arc/MetJ family transcription regulator